MSKEQIKYIKNYPLQVVLLLVVCCSPGEKDTNSPGFGLKVEQLTSGPKHHFFGYIGHCQTIPWNSTGQYILGMEIENITRLPKPEEAANIFIIDTRNNKIIYLDKTHAWNPQQGTMFYWSPMAPETQFLFNDRDLETGKVFTVIYDIKERKRVKEYRFDDTPIGNSGVAIDGSAWLGVNFGRMARLRLVTGYPEAFDFSANEIAPDNDGIFIIDMKTGNKKLLVSFEQIESKIKETKPDLNHTGLFINLTLWNRNSEIIYFFARAGWDGHGGDRVNVPFTIKADGTGLTAHSIHIGGHPEWDTGNVIFGSAEDEKGEMRQVRYDVVRQEIIEYMGNPKIFPEPEGDIALSPDANWFVNGYESHEKKMNFYTVLRRVDGAYALSPGISNGGFTNRGPYGSNVRIDAAPRWNRTNDAILVPGIDENETRQLFLIRVVPSS